MNRSLPDQRFDTLIIGSGVAGLFAALRARQHGSVMLATKSSLSQSNTRYAQGGIAAALFPDDSVDSHIDDTLAAGAGLCNEEAVRVLCTEGPQRVRELIAIGVSFDRTDDGVLARGMEAAHSAARVIHSGGDATGAEVQRGLEAAVLAADITVQENTFLTNLIAEENSVKGATFLTTGGATHEVTTHNVFASAVIIASGGAGQTYRFTTNPRVATGDGVAAAFRAGAVVEDPEMYQFHPTLLAGPGAFLISEAVRGEGAVLRNAKGKRFMVDRHPRAELAPRDVVARAIAEEMASQNGEPVLLDATSLSAEFLAHRFPTIDAHCKAINLHWATTPIPVTPAAHFWMGGIATNSWGQTSLQGLYAIGEAACSGVHGANRLASNSLLEGLVFADRAVQHIATQHIAKCATQPYQPSDVEQLPAQSFPQSNAMQSELTTAEVRQLAWDYLGLVRNEHGLRVATKQLTSWASELPRPTTSEEWERLNLVTVAQLIAAGASRRKESRGAHYRTDFPNTTVATASHTFIQHQP